MLVAQVPEKDTGLLFLKDSEGQSATWPESRHCGVLILRYRHLLGTAPLSQIPEYGGWVAIASMKREQNGNRCKVGHWHCSRDQDRSTVLV